MRILKIILKVVVILALVTLIVMTLWNWLIPDIFKGPAITYVQALGLLVLSKLLFMGFGGGFGRRGWRHHHYWRRKKFEEYLKTLTPEEQEKVKAKFEHRCG